jgi:hypothetical protein
VRHKEAWCAFAHRLHVCSDFGWQRGDTQFEQAANVRVDEPLWLRQVGDEHHQHVREVAGVERMAVVHDIEGAATDANT